MKSRRRRRFLLIGPGLTLLVLIAAAAAIAGARGDSPQQEGVAPNVFVQGGASGGIYFTRVLTQTTPFTTSSTGYVNLTATSIGVPPGRAALISADFSAETRCSGGGTLSTDFDWCQARILIWRSGNPIGEGYPQVDTSDSGSPFALDSTNNGREGIASYEGHAFSRSRVISNPTTVTQTAFVYLQVKVTNFNGTPPAFWIDDYHLRVTAQLGGFGLP